MSKYFTVVLNDLSAVDRALLFGRCKIVFDLNTWPGLFKRCRKIELRESALSAAHAQVLGKQFFQILPLPTQPKAEPSDVFASVCYV